LARLYSNENFPFPVVEELRRLGHDVVTIQERGHGGEAASDPEVLAWATVEDRSVLTLNRRHFIQLHRKDSKHPGIIVCTVDPDFVEQARRIHSVIQQAGDLSGQLLRVNRPG
jgi:predicted nuclease of predicted toxin-antitoxin system